MTRSAILSAVKPFIGYLPRVSKPTFAPSFQERVKWTLYALVIFLMCCQIPVYGGNPPGSSDPFYWMRVILASNKGTLMEFGISPIVTASMIMQLLQAGKLIEYDQRDKEEVELFQGAQKLLGLGMVILEVVAYVLTGQYGDIGEIGALNATLIIGQLFVSCLICLVLDELLSNGWGIGSGISLFIAVNIAETIMWKMFSPIFVNVGRGNEVEGAVFALFHLLFSRHDKSRAILEAFYRPQLPNMTNLLATLFIFLVVVFLQGFQVNLTFVHRRQKGNIFQYPIKLFYTSNMPIILQSALLSNLFFVSKLLWARLGNDSLLCAILGRWEEPEYAGNDGMTVAVGGAAYYASPPTSMHALYEDPVHAVIYLCFMLGTCAFFSRLWIEISGQSPKDVADKLKEQDLTIRGYTGDEKAIYSELKRYIPTAASFGGMCVGALSVIGDFLGAIGSGTGILLAVGTIQEYYEAYQKEQKGPETTAASKYQSHITLGQRG